MTRQPITMHGRDHCPGGADPIPCWPTGGGGTVGGWAQFQTSSWSLVGLTEQANPWESWDMSDFSIAGTYDNGSGSPSSPTNSGTDDAITLLKVGVYILSARVQWATPIPAGSYSMLSRGITHAASYAVSAYAFPVRLVDYAICWVNDASSPFPLQYLHSLGSGTSKTLSNINIDIAYIPM